MKLMRKGELASILGRFGGGNRARGLGGIPEPAVPAADAPAAAPAPAASPAPVTDPTPIARPAPVADPRPIVRPTPVASPAPEVVSTPVAGPTPVDSPTPEVVPAVNLDTLRELSDGIHDQDGTLLLELIEKFLHGGDHITVGLARAAAAGDVPQAHQLAHNLISASTLMGAVPLADLLRLVQHVGVDEPAELVPLTVQVETEYRRVAATMRQLGTVGISSHDEANGDATGRSHV